MLVQGLKITDKVLFGLFSNQKLSCAATTALLTSSVAIIVLQETKQSTLDKMSTKLKPLKDYADKISPGFIKGLLASGMFITCGRWLTRSCISRNL